jgi:hypothetical protein
VNLAGHESKLPCHDFNCPHLRFGGCHGRHRTKRQGSRSAYHGASVDVSWDWHSIRFSVPEIP